MWTPMGDLQYIFVMVHLDFHIMHRNGAVHRFGTVHAVRVGKRAGKKSHQDARCARP